MNIIVKAHYKNGVIEPLEKLDLPDGCELTLTIAVETAEEGALQEWLEGVDAFRESLPMTSDSVPLLRALREERSS